jgi:hypothetical protein
MLRASSEHSNDFLDNIHKGADKFLAFPISYFPICSTKTIFLGWVKEVRATKS